MIAYLRCICKSTDSWALRIARRLVNPFVFELDEQLKFLKSTHGSKFQFNFACMLDAATLHIGSKHSGGGAAVGIQSSSSV